MDSKEDFERGSSGNDAATARLADAGVTATDGADVAPSASMPPASAASETDQSWVELMMTRTMAKMADAGVPPAERALRQKTLARQMADTPAGSTPADLTGVLSRALLEMADADAGAKVLDTWSPAPSAAPAANDQGPPPSAPPLELLMEDELLDDTPPPPPAPPPPGGACAPARGGTIPAGGRRHGAEPNPGWVPPRTSEAHQSRERMPPPAEAMVITMPVCEAVRMGGGGATTQDVEGDSGRGENDALVGCSVRCGKFAMIGLLSLGLVSVSAAVVVTMLVLKGDDPVTTSTSSTAVATSTSSTSSTTMPEMNTVSDTSPACSFFFRRQGATSHAITFDATICLPVRAHRRDLDLGATGFGHRRRCCRGLLGNFGGSLRGCQDSRGRSPWSLW